MTMSAIPIDLPLSKSLLNRALVIIAGQGRLSSWLNDNPDVISNGCRDTRLLIDALLGIEHNRSNPFYFQDAGTPCRLFTAFAAAKFSEQIEIKGNDSLNNRSIEPLVTGLMSMGAEIQYLGQHGFTPLSIKKGIQQWKDVRISAAISSQYASAFLLIAPLFSGTKNIVVTESSHSQAYLEMTVDILKRMGIEISSTQITSEIHYTIQGEYQDLDAHIPSDIFESDWSSAAFFYPLLLGLPQNTILELRGLNPNSSQGDAALSYLGNSLGIKTIKTENGISILRDGNSPDAFHQNVSDGEILNTETTINLKNNPDLAPALIVGWCIMGRTLLIQGIHNLRFKECDRIAALQNNIKALGCTLTSLGTEVDDLWILDSSHRSFPSQMHIETHSDHRIAMAFAALKPWIPDLSFSDTTCVEKSFPQFWEQWKKCTFE